MSKVAKAFVGNDGVAHKQADPDPPEYMECGIELSPQNADIYRGREAATDAGNEWCEECWSTSNDS